VLAVSDIQLITPGCGLAEHAPKER
jgi:hypothetical protein